VKLRAPTEVGKLHEQIDDILKKSNVSASKLLSQIDQDIHSQADFLKLQNNLLLKSCHDFRKVLARIFFLEKAAELLRINQSAEEPHDEENRLLEDPAQKQSELTDQLLQAG